MAIFEIETTHTIADDLGHSDEITVAPDPDGVGLPTIKVGENIEFSINVEQSRLLRKCLEMVEVQCEEREALVLNQIPVPTV